MQGAYFYTQKGAAGACLLLLRRLPPYRSHYSQAFPNTGEGAPGLTLDVLIVALITLACTLPISELTGTWFRWANSSSAPKQWLQIFSPLLVSYFGDSPVLKTFFPFSDLRLLWRWGGGGGRYPSRFYRWYVRYGRDSWAEVMDGEWERFRAWRAARAQARADAKAAKAAGAAPPPGQSDAPDPPAPPPPPPSPARPGSGRSNWPRLLGKTPRAGVGCVPRMCIPPLEIEASRVDAAGRMVVEPPSPRRSPPAALQAVAADGPRLDSFTANFTARRAKRVRGTAVGVAFIAILWVVMVWIIFTYGELVYKLLGAGGLDQYAFTYGVSVGLEQLSKWSEILKELATITVGLLLLDRFNLTTNEYWLEAHIDFLSMQAALFAHAAKRSLLTTASFYCACVISRGATALCCSRFPPREDHYHKRTT